MLPLKPDIPLAVIHVFNGLRDKARERAIATGNYDELVKSQAQEQREPGDDDEPAQHRTAFDSIDDEVPL